MSPLAAWLWTLLSWLCLTWHDTVGYAWHWYVLRHEITWTRRWGYWEKRCECQEVWR